MQKTMDWEKAEPKFWQIFFACGALEAMPIFYIFGAKGLGFYILGSASFAIEFKLIILIGKLFVGLLRGNFLAIAGIFAAKILLWLALASAPFWLPTGFGAPFALGCLVFATAIFVFLLLILGPPRLEKPHS